MKHALALLICVSGSSIAADLPPPEATEQWQPVPEIVSASSGSVPSDAIVLFSGSDLKEWQAADGKPAPWTIVDGAMVVAAGSGDIRTRRAFGDMQLHLEFKTPAPPKGEGQGRGNSGIFFMGLYELQILDSYRNKTYVNGQAGSIYKQFPPLVNASRAPGEWQSYDVVFTAPRFLNGKVTPARITAFHNGVLIQNEAVLRGGTVYRGEPGYTAHAAALPLSLQDHGNPVAFRNIWVRPLDHGGGPAIEGGATRKSAR